MSSKEFIERAFCITIFFYLRIHDRKESV